MSKIVGVASGIALLVGSLTIPSASHAGEASAPERQSVVRNPIAVFSLVAPTTESASGLIARAVFAAGAGCPELSLEISTARGTQRMGKAMQRRSTGATTLNAFGSLLVCEAAIPRHAMTAKIAGRSIPASVSDSIERIALLGDSGCRIKDSVIQNCNDPNAWPFARNSLQVARERPDVTIFLGDFFYRESPCPESANSWCGGSPEPLVKAPFKDSAWGWVADVLVPMAPLLPAAPIVMIRGNHELCERGGNGFFLIFDPAFGTAKNCAPSSTGVIPTVYSPTTAVDLAIKGDRTLRLVNVDSANGDDSAVDAAIAVQQRPLFQRAERLARGSAEAWLLTHRPIAGLFSTEKLPNPPGLSTPWSSLTQTYASYGLLDPFALTVSSHIHLAQVNQIPGLPPEVILGNAGTELEPPTGYGVPQYGPLSDAAGQPLVPGLQAISTATFSRTWVKFGYAMATPTKSGWRVQLKDDDGKGFATCQLARRQISCR